MNLSTPGRQAPGDPAVAVSPGARAIVAWWRHDSALAPDDDVVQIRRRADFAAPFLGPVTLDASADNFFPSVDAAVAPDGAGLVGWTNQTLSASATAVVLRSLPVSGAPPMPVTLSEGAQARLGDLSVGLGAGGAGVAIWGRDPVPLESGRGGDDVVRVAVHPAAIGAWSAAGDLSAPGATHPVLAAAPDGSALVAWERANAIEISSIGADGVVAGAPVVISAPGGVARLPGVALNAAGEAVVAWYQDGAVQVSERTAGGAFSAPHPISSVGGLPDTPNFGGPAVALSADGRAVTAWRRTAAPGGLRIEAAIRPVGLGWGAAAVLSPPSSRNAGRPSLGMDAKGRAALAWSQPSGRSLSLIRARMLARAGSAFGALEKVSTPLGRGTAPAVALDAKGRSVLAWREDPIGGSGRFFRAAIRFSPG